MAKQNKQGEKEPASRCPHAARYVRTKEGKKISSTGTLTSLFLSSLANIFVADFGNDKMITLSRDTRLRPGLIFVMKLSSVMCLAALKCQSVYACVCNYADIRGIRVLKRSLLTGLRVSRSAGTVTVG